MSARPFWARKPFKKQCVGKRPKSSIKRGVCGASKPFKKQALRKRRKTTNKTKILPVKNIRLMQVFRLKKIRQTATQILIYKCFGGRVLRSIVWMHVFGSLRAGFFDFARGCLWGPHFAGTSQPQNTVYQRVRGFLRILSDLGTFWSKMAFFGVCAVAGAKMSSDSPSAFAIKRSVKTSVRCSATPGRAKTRNFE